VAPHLLVVTLPELSLFSIVMGSWNHSGAPAASPLEEESAMWILEWGNSTNQVSGQWNHEEHESSEKALDAAKTKTGMGLIANAIHSPAGVLWMKAEELLDTVEADETPSAS
jgi:hypothetical protein